jgi:uncharacterized protein YjiS (DUF1127 family)
LATRDLHLDQYHSEPQPFRGVARLVASLQLWRRRARQRGELAAMDALSQRDLALSDADIWLEINKRPWQS